MSSIASLIAMPERTRVVGRLAEDLPAVLRAQRRACHDLRSVGLHEHPAVRLLVVARADHEHLDLEPEDGPGEGERAAPLAGPGLGREAGHALGLVVVRLGERGVRLVAARRAPALVLVVDVGGGIERLLEPMGPEERARPVQPVGVADRLRDLDLAVRAHHLGDERHREQRRQVGRADRLAGARVEDRFRADREVGRDVVPGARDLLLVEDELGASRAHDGHGLPPPPTPTVGRGRASLRRAAAQPQAWVSEWWARLPMSSAAAARRRLTMPSASTARMRWVLMSSISGSFRH